jgi:hypothetical protein
MHTDTPDVVTGDALLTIHLTGDEALVLNEFLYRGQAAGNDYSTFEDQAELRVLWDLAAVLETRLPLVNNPRYEEMLAAARDRVRDSDE